MDESAWIRNKIRSFKICGFLLLFPVSANSIAFFQNRQTTQGDIREHHSGAVFKSAFPPRQTGLPTSGTVTAKDTLYTIQVCTMYVLIDDIFLTGLYGIRPVRMGDLFRYIYSGYATMEEARKDLPKVRKYFPQAFIREYDGKHLGKAIDLIEH